MKKTLFLIAREFRHNSGSYSGVFQEIAQHMSKRGYDVIILCGRQKAQTKIEKRNYANIIRFQLSPYSVPLLGMNLDYFILGKHVKKYFKTRIVKDSDIILANGRASLGVLGKRYIVRIGQPAKTFLSNMEIANDQVSMVSKVARKIHFSLQFYLEKQSVSAAAGIISPSLESYRLLTKEYGGGDKPYFIPQSGIKKIFFKIKKPKKRKLTKILFVCSGTEEIRKGIYYLRDPIIQTLEAHPNVVFVHVGDKIDFGIPAKYKDRFVSTGKVSFEQIWKHYSDADFMVSTALSEGMPNAILEAMASGMPVLSSDINGIQEYILHKEEGYIFKRGDQEKLMQGIKFMLDNDKRLREMGARARKRVTKLVYENYTKELFDFFTYINIKDKEKSINLLN